MLRKTDGVNKEGRTIYVDEQGKKQVLPIVRPKHGARIPDWCFKFIQPIRATGNHWSVKKNCMVTA